MRNFPRSQSRSDDQLVELIIIHFKVIFFQLRETLLVAWCYYRFGKFFLSDLLLTFLYLFNSPFRIAKRFLHEHGEDPYTYGETPLTTLDHIARQCRILSKDVIYELGSGSGRAVFWLACVIGCEVHGIDLIPAFIRKAEKVKRLLGTKKVFFEQENFLSASFEGATVIYLFGTTLDDDTIRRLTKRLAALKSGTKVITVSYPLTDYDTQFHVEKQFSGHFPWGEADIYLNVRH